MKRTDRDLLPKAEISHPSASTAWALAAATLVALAISCLPQAWMTPLMQSVQPAGLDEPIGATSSTLVQEAVAAQEGAFDRYNSLDWPRLSAFFRVDAVMLALATFGVVLSRIVRASPMRAWLFPVTVALILVVQLVGFRWALGATLGAQRLAPGQPQVSSGYIYDDIDNFAYAGFAAQAKAGRFTFQDLYTTEPNPAAYFNPYMLLVGIVARWCDVPVALVMNVLGLVGAAISVIAAYDIALRLGFSPAAARWGAVLTAFASGLTVLVIGLHLIAGTPLVMGVDVIYTEAVLYSSFCSFPYHSAMFGLLAVAMWLVAIWEQRLVENRPQAPITMALGIVTLLLIASHPYEGLILAGMYGLYAALSATWSERSQWLSRWRLTALLFAIVLPLTGYNVWVSQQPAWSHYARVSLALWNPRHVWIIGYGLVLPLALIGGVATFGRRLPLQARWLGAWVLVSMLLMIGVNTPQFTRLCNGVYMPMCILAGSACAMIAARIHGMRSRPVRLAMGTFGAVALSLCFSTSVGMWFYSYRDLAYDTELWEVADELKRQSPETPPVVLCDTRTARLMTAVGPARIFAGHWSLTPDYAPKRAQLQEAGFERGAANSATRPLAFATLLDQARPDFVLTHAQTPAASFAAANDHLVAIGHYGAWTLFVAKEAQLSPGQQTITEPGN